MAETKVTEQDVMYVADLANLELTAEEKDRMIRDLNSILEHIDTLNELDTSDVPPLAEVVSEARRARKALAEVALHSATISWVLRSARSRTWSSFIPSHQNLPPISATSGRPFRTWRTNSRGDA